MKALGIDYGRRRIGVALTDELGITARPLTVIDRHKTPDPLPGLADLASAHAPSVIVVGVPLDHCDNETVMSKEARAFGGRLHEATGIPVKFVDESRTSKRAQDILRSRRKKQRRDKSNVDRIAACLILETFREESGCGQ